LGKGDGNQRGQWRGGNFKRLVPVGYGAEGKDPVYFFQEYLLEKLGILGLLEKELGETYLHWEGKRLKKTHTGKRKIDKWIKSGNSGMS